MEIPALRAAGAVPAPNDAPRGTDARPPRDSLAPSEPHHRLLGRTGLPPASVRPTPPTGTPTRIAGERRRPAPLSSEQYVAHLITRLQQKFPETYGQVHPTVRIEPMGRGLGKTSGNTITLNRNAYGAVTMSNFGTIAITLAHEMRHVKQPWWVNLSQKLPITDEPHWWNASHVELDLAAEADAYALLDELYLFLRDRGQFE